MARILACPCGQRIKAANAPGPVRARCPACGRTLVLNFGAKPASAGAAVSDISSPQTSAAQKSETPHAEQDRPDAAVQSPQATPEVSVEDAEKDTFDLAPLADEDRRSEVPLPPVADTKTFPAADEVIRLYEAMNRAFRKAASQSAPSALGLGVGVLAGPLVGMVADSFSEKAQDRRTLEAQGRQSRATLANKGYPVEDRKLMEKLVLLLKNREIRVLTGMLTSNPDKRARAAAAVALCDLGASAWGRTEAFIAALTDREPVVVFNAVHVLGTAAAGGQLSPAAIPGLVSALRHADPTVRGKVAWALGQAGPAARQCQDSLLLALNDSKLDVRAQAADALSRIGTDPKLFIAKVIDDLCHARQIPDRNILAGAIARYGPKVAGIIPTLIELFARGDRDLDPLTRRVLCAMGAAALPALEQALGDARERIREAAATTLGCLGSQGLPATNALLEALQDASAGVRAASAKALASVAWKSPGPESQQAIEALTRVLQDPKRHVRNEAECALKRLQRP